MSDQGSPTWTAAEESAMRRALELAASPGVPTGPNPRVGCVLLDDQGRTVAEGHHRGAGTAHAEADAYGNTHPHTDTHTNRCTHPDPHADAYSGAVFLRYRRISDV